MRIAYITAHTPFGRGETFILGEMLSIVESGAELIVFPRNPPREVFHREARSVIDRAIWLPLLDGKILFYFVLSLFLQSRLWGVLWLIVRYSRTLKILFKNVAVVPKAIFVTGLLRGKEVDHIHAHWGSTTSTMAWIISELGAIPWSLTVHRWDIAEDNMLKLKVERSIFTRCISEGGRREVLDIVGERYRDKVTVLHAGVRCIDGAPRCSSRAPAIFTIACPANFLKVKGHRFLIEACRLLLNRGRRKFHCLLIGDGPLLSEIRWQMECSGMEGHVEFTGRLPHNDIMHLYERGDVDVVVLPSVVTAKGDKEGIPVALMEAMSYGIPVISTKTGSIPELLSDGAGIMVEEKDPRQLAEALLRLFDDAESRDRLAEVGYQRVGREYNLAKNTRRLLKMMKGASAS